MCEDFLVCVTIGRYVWRCVNVGDDVGGDVCDTVSMCVTMFCYVWLCVGISDNVSM